MIQTELSSDPFKEYRLATASGLSKGALLLDLSWPQLTYAAVDDVQPRHIFKIPRGPQQSLINIRPVDECPSLCVSAADIVHYNDGKYNWTDTADFDANDPADLATISFAAQTPLAASYGLMQEMYQVAAELHWRTTDGRDNPSLLFDTPQNLAVGGGSMAVGTLEFYKRYRQCRPGDWAADPNFVSSTAYHDMIIAALNYYNHGPKNANTNYGADAWNFSQQFSPTHPLSKIFP